jgi:DNA topoisomerase-3
VITSIRNGDVVDRYHTSGTAVQQVGWKALDIAAARKPGKGKTAGDEQKAEQVLPSGLKKGVPQEVVEVEAVRKKTRPPKRFTEGTLLTAMETAGKLIEIVHPEVKNRCKTRSGQGYSDFEAQSSL